MSRKRVGKSSWARWVRAQDESGAFHAFSFLWEEGDTDPARTLPVCGKPVRRETLGRLTAPPRQDPVCAQCAAAVGFRRRPRQSAVMQARYAGVQERTLALRVGDLEAQHGELRRELRELRALVNAYLAPDDAPAES